MPIPNPSSSPSFAELLRQALERSQANPPSVAALGTEGVAVDGGPIYDSSKGKSTSNDNNNSDDDNNTRTFNDTPGGYRARKSAHQDEVDNQKEGSENNGTEPIRPPVTPLFDPIRAARDKGPGNAATTPSKLPPDYSSVGDPSTVEIALDGHMFLQYNIVKYGLFVLVNPFEVVKILRQIQYLPLRNPLERRRLLQSAAAAAESEGDDEDLRDDYYDNIDGDEDEDDDDDDNNNVSDTSKNDQEPRPQSRKHQRSEHQRRERLRKEREEEFFREYRRRRHSSQQHHEDDDDGEDAFGENDDEDEEEFDEWNENEDEEHQDQESQQSGRRKQKDMQDEQGKESKSFFGIFFWNSGTRHSESSTPTDIKSTEEPLAASIQSQSTPRTDLTSVGYLSDPTPEYRFKPVMRGGYRTMREMVRHEGILTLFKGLLASYLFDFMYQIVQPSVEGSLSEALDLPEDITALVQMRHITPYLNVFVASHAITGLLLSPLELIQTRLTVQSLLPKYRKYNGITHCAMTIAKEEGLLALYSYPVLTCVFHALVSVFKNMSTLVLQHLIGMESTSVTYVLSAMGIHVLELLITLPLQTIRRRLQAQAESQRMPGSALATVVRTNRVPYTGPWDCFRRIVRENGWRALYVGWQVHAITIAFMSGVNLLSTIDLGALDDDSEE